MDLNLSELKQLIGREITSCLQPGRHPSASEQQLLTKVAAAEQLPKLSSDVTLTKVAAPERLAEKEKEGKVGRPWSGWHFCARESECFRALQPYSW